MSTKLYQCRDCGNMGVKLWRPYQSFDVHLRCVSCAEKKSGKQCELRPEVTTYHRGRRRPSDQMGWLVPAVPDVEPNDENTWECGEAFWGYTSVPAEGCAWWNALPLFTSKQDERRRAEFYAMSRRLTQTGRAWAETLNEYGPGSEEGRLVRLITRRTAAEFFRLMPLAP